MDNDIRKLFCYLLIFWVLFGQEKNLWGKPRLYNLKDVAQLDGALMTKYILWFLFLIINIFYFLISITIILRSVFLIWVWTILGSFRPGPIFNFNGNNTEVCVSHWGLSYIGLFRPGPKNCSEYPEKNNRVNYINFFFSFKFIYVCSLLFQILHILPLWF